MPQNIDMQDRIIGPLTMLQFVYAVVGAGGAYAILMSAPKPFSYFLAAPVALFTIAMIFVKVNERPFLDFFLSMLQFLSTPKQRVWHHENADNLQVIIFRSQGTEKKIETKEISAQKIHEVAEKADRE